MLFSAPSKNRPYHFGRFPLDTLPRDANLIASESAREAAKTAPLAINAPCGPLASAAQTVPGGPTVACSTPEAVLWDKALQELNDPSGRAMRAVHQDAY